MPSKQHTHANGSRHNNKNSRSGGDLFSGPDKVELPQQILAGVKLGHLGVSQPLCVASLSPCLHLLQTLHPGIVPSLHQNITCWLQPPETKDTQLYCYYLCTVPVPFFERKLIKRTARIPFGCTMS